MVTKKIFFFSFSCWWNRQRNKTNGTNICCLHVPAGASWKKRLQVKSTLFQGAVAYCSDGCKTCRGPHYLHYEMSGIKYFSLSLRRIGSDVLSVRRRFGSCRLAATCTGRSPIEAIRSRDIRKWQQRGVWISNAQTDAKYLKSLWQINEVSVTWRPPKGCEELTHICCLSHSLTPLPAKFASPQPWQHPASSKPQIHVCSVFSPLREKWSQSVLYLTVEAEFSKSPAVCENGDKTLHYNESKY